MKKMKTFSMILACLLTFTAFGCKDQGGDSLTPVNPMEDAQTHTIQGTLHKKNIDYGNGKVFVKDGKTDYKIIVSNDAKVIEAANYIANHVYSVTGVALKVEQFSESLIDTYANDKSYIIMDSQALFAKAGLQMPTDDIGETGYYIKTTGNSVFIEAFGAEGYQLGALAFLRAVIGYDMLGTDAYVYSLDGSILPQMEIIERPDYDYRVGCDSANRYGMGFTNNNILIPVDGDQWHNSFNYLPPETHMETHPDWYSDRAQKDNVTSTLPGYGQLCYNAHGNEEELQEMIQTLYAKLKAIVDVRVDLSNITITQQDNTVACQCDVCTEMKNEYGSNAAAIIKFVNAIDDLLQADLQREAEQSGKKKREMNISFFAYRATVDAPVTKNADGSYTAINAIKCNENVGVVLAPITASYTNSFYEEENLHHAENVKAWGAVSDKIYMWIYETNFSNYFFPLATWYDSTETMRFLKDNGAIYCFSQSQWDNPMRTGFSLLKEYINSKVEFDVNVNVNEVIDKYFEEYFKDANEPMREFFDGIQAWYDHLVEAYPANLSGGYKDDIAKAEYWPKRLLDGWMECIDEALMSIEKYRDTDPVLYKQLKDRITIESIFPRFAIISFYSGYIKDLEAEKQSFKQDALRLGFTHYYEHNAGLLENLWSEWGV